MVGEITHNGEKLGGPSTSVQSFHHFVNTMAELPSQGNRLHMGRDAWDYLDTN